MSAESLLSLSRGSMIFHLISNNFLFDFQNNFFSKIGLLISSCSLCWFAHYVTGSLTFKASHNGHRLQDFSVDCL